MHCPTLLALVLSTTSLYVKDRTSSQTTLPTRGVRIIRCPTTRSGTDVTAWSAFGTRSRRGQLAARPSVGTRDDTDVEEDRLEAIMARLVCRHPWPV